MKDPTKIKKKLVLDFALSFYTILNYTLHQELIKNNFICYKKWFEINLKLHYRLVMKYLVVERFWVYVFF